MPLQKNSNEMEIEQVVLSEECHPGVLKLAHTIPLVGHLVKTRQHSEYYIGSTDHQFTKM